MTLTLRRLQFIDEYIIDRNGIQAAIRAGYSAKAAGKMAHTLLSDYRVRGRDRAACGRTVGARERVGGAGD
jgi:phage terminase small subunit